MYAQVYSTTHTVCVDNLLFLSMYLSVINVVYCPSNTNKHNYTCRQVRYPQTHYMHVTVVRLYSVQSVIAKCNLPVCCIRFTCAFKNSYYTSDKFCCCMLLIVYMRIIGKVHAPRVRKLCTTWLLCKVSVFECGTPAYTFPRVTCGIYMYTFP